MDAVNYHLDSLEAWLVHYKMMMKVVDSLLDRMEVW